MFRRLYHQIELFVTHYYTLHDLNQGEFFEPWKEIDFSSEFIAWAEQVAEGEWDGILRDGVQRKWFVMGILVRVLKVKVFDEGLFGGNEREGEFLRGLEKALFTREGISLSLFPSFLISDKSMEMVYCTNTRWDRIHTHLPPRRHHPHPPRAARRNGEFLPFCRFSNRSNRPPPAPSNLLSLLHAFPHVFIPHSPSDPRFVSIPT
jgi:hypothetical protein